jgi:hypothetical protein
VSGDVYCNTSFWGAEVYWDNFIAQSNYDQAPSIPPLDPNAPVLEVDCGLRFEPDIELGIFGYQKVNVWGFVDADVSCVVATGACSANVNGSANVYQAGDGPSGPGFLGSVAGPTHLNWYMRS